MKTRKSTPDELNEASTRTFAEIASLAGLTVTQLCERFSIPRRTATGWCNGSRTPPIYILLLVQEALGLIRR